MNSHKKYLNFLESIKKINPTLIEGIITAYKAIYETTEEQVDDLKSLLAQYGGDDDESYNWGSVAPRDEDRADMPEELDSANPRYGELFDEMGETELGDEVEYVLGGMGLLGGRKEEEAVNKLHSLLTQIKLAEEISPFQKKQLNQLLDTLMPLIDKRRAGGSSDEEDSTDREKAESAAKRISKENEAFADLSGDEAADELERELFSK